MDIRVFDNNSLGVTPLLVKLYDSHELYKDSDRQVSDIKEKLVSVVSELFKTELSFGEKEVITDILIELMRSAENDLRLVLSECLSTIEDLPLRLALHITNEEIEIARPILANSTALTDLDLIYIIKAKTPEYWDVIAQRPALSEPVIKALSDTGDVNTISTLVRAGHLGH